LKLPFPHPPGAQILDRLSTSTSVSIHRFVGKFLVRIVICKIVYFSPSSNSSTFPPSQLVSAFVCTPSKTLPFPLQNTLISFDRVFYCFSALNTDAKSPFLARSL
jgi:hypothetical protein